MARVRVVQIRYECGAPDEVFLPDWNDVPAELKAKIPNGMNCDGGGVPGEWCPGCPWARRPVEETTRMLKTPVSREETT